MGEVQLGRSEIRSIHHTTKFLTKMAKNVRRKPSIVMLLYQRQHYDKIYLNRCFRARIAIIQRKITRNVKSPKFQHLFYKNRGQDNSRFWIRSKKIGLLSCSHTRKEVIW